MLGSWWNALITALTNWLTAFGPVQVSGTFTPAAANPETYSALHTFAPGALPTDIFVIRGSATKVVRVKKVSIAGTSSAVGNAQLQLIRRSTVDTGGVSFAPPMVPHDTLNAVATALVEAFTSPPTVGTVVGSVDGGFVTEPLTGGADNALRLVLTPQPGDQSWVLRGVTQQLCLARNAVTMTAELVVCVVEFTEE